MDSQNEEAALCLYRTKQPVSLVSWTETGQAPTAWISPIGVCRSSSASKGGGATALDIDRKFRTTNFEHIFAKLEKYHLNSTSRNLESAYDSAQR
jgi:hypothetical protein